MKNQGKPPEVPPFSRFFVRSLVKGHVLPARSGCQSDNGSCESRARSARWSDPNRFSVFTFS